jgi:hypothetical protein
MEMWVKLPSVSSDCHSETASRWSIYIGKKKKMGRGHVSVTQRVVTADQHKIASQSCGRRD